MKVLASHIIIIISLLVGSTTFAQTKYADQSSQFIFDDYAVGEVLMKNGNKHSARMNYNAVTEKIVFEQSGQLLELANLHTIDTVYLHGRKFTPVKGAFFEKIETTPIPFFVQHKRKLVRSKKKVGFGETSELATTYGYSSAELDGYDLNLPLTDNYEVTINPVFWVLKDGKMKSFSTERQLLKIFSKKKNEIKEYIKNEKLNIENIDDVVKIIAFSAKDN